MPGCSSVGVGALVGVSVGVGLGIGSSAMAIAVGGATPATGSMTASEVGVGADGPRPPACADVKTARPSVTITAARTMKPICERLAVGRGCGRTAIGLFLRVEPRLVWRVMAAIIPFFQGRKSKRTPRVAVQSIITRGRHDMSIHQNRRLWQRHVLAENRRSIEGLLDTLCADPCTDHRISEKYRGREAVAGFIARCFRVCRTRYLNW